MRRIFVIAASAFALAPRADAQTVGGELRPSLDVMAPTVPAAQRPALRGAAPEAEASSEPAPSPEAGLVRRRPPPDESDPFAPLGIRAGSFLISPSAEFEGGYGDNLNFSASDPRAGAFGRVTGAALLRSDWSRHALEASIRGSIDSDTHGDPVLGPTLDAELRGRIDVSRRTRLETALTYSQFVALPSSVTFPFGAANRPEIRQSNLRSSLTHEFNRLSITASGLVSRFESGDVVAADGSVLPGRDRAFDSAEGRLRVGYEATDGFKPFADVFVNRRDYDRPLDATGVLRGSDGVGAEAGVELGRPHLITGEAALGWQEQKSRDPLLPSLSGITTRAALAWSLTPVTVLRLRASTNFDETPLAVSTLALTRSVGVDLEHSPRSDLTYLANATFTQADYAGTPIQDRWTKAGVALVYKANRELWYRVNYSYEQLDSTLPGVSYRANVVTLGVKLQR